LTFMSASLNALDPKRPIREADIQAGDPALVDAACNEKGRFFRRPKSGKTPQEEALLIKQEKCHQRVAQLSRAREDRAR
jgi:hypothetical protein